MTRRRATPPEPARVQITIAVLTGLVTGVAREVVNWLLDWLTTG
jgi:hypothetical protein